MTDPRPISATFDLSSLSTDSMRERVRRAFTIVDRVHTDGGLPRIPIDHIVDPDAWAQYRSQANRGRALGIGIDPFEPHVELALVHEIGHFLDHQALGNRGGFASNRHPRLARWRQSVTATYAFRRLKTLERSSSDTLAIVLERAVDPDDWDLISHLLRYTENWARCYVQYITAVSDDLVLRHQLTEERTISDPIASLGFWDDNDFLPVHHAIDVALRQMGWIDEITDPDR